MKWKEFLEALEQYRSASIEESSLREAVRRSDPTKRLIREEYDEAFDNFTRLRSRLVAMADEYETEIEKLKSQSSARISYFEDQFESHKERSILSKDAINQAFRGPNRRLLVVGSSDIGVRLGAFSAFKNNCPQSLIEKVNMTDSTFWFTNGSSLRFLVIDDVAAVNRILGSKIDWVGYDRLSPPSKEVKEALRVRNMESGNTSTECSDCNAQSTKLDEGIFNELRELLGRANAILYSNNTAGNNIVRTPYKE